MLDRHRSPRAGSLHQAVRTLLALLVLAVVLAQAAVAIAATPPGSAPKIVMEEFMVPAKDPSIELYVRNKRPEGMSQFRPERTLLYVHGATYPSETAFDLQLDGLSWMDYIAQRGYDVYLLDLRGYGRSTRPKEMDEPAANNEPIVTTDVAVRDISAVVEHILQKRGIAKLNLMGWSWGTTTMAAYTTANPGKVERLVLFAPVWVRNPPQQPDPSAPKLGAYRTVTREAAQERWLTGVPEDKKSGLIPAGWFDAWWNATSATDPVGAKQNPPVLRAPNGVRQDLINHWFVGKPLYDPAKITVPTLIVVAEWDRDTPPYMAQTLFPLLTGAPAKRLVMLGEGTHTVIMEKNRMQLFSVVQNFLEDDLSS